MRIALISEHASPLAVPAEAVAGTQHVQVAELAAALVHAGHDVRVYTRREATASPEAVPATDGYLVCHVPVGQPARDQLLPYLGEFGRWLAAAWRDGGWLPDVAHAHFWTSGLATLHAARRTGVPVVQTYHGLGTVARRQLGLRDTSPPGRIGYERAIGRAVDRVVVQCQDEVAELLRLGVPRSRMTLVPTGVDLRLFRPDGPIAPRDPTRPRIITVAPLTAGHGLSELVRAMPAVPDAECVVVGGPDADRLATDQAAQRLRAFATACRVADRVRLVGALPRWQRGPWYRSADLLVAADWSAPDGLAPLEGMACGLPVVGTTVGGIADTVVDGLTGDLVPPRDPRALGTAIRRLLRDRVRRFSYATAALDRVRSRYSWKRAVEQLSAVYAMVGGMASPASAVA